MDGSRRVRATSVLPRYSPPCLFTGHLSTKSNAFCTDSSSLRLSTLQLVKNHMAIHYNKILSAKAAVDCSIPVSVNTSIKYADQQRREKLRKELARCEKEFKLSKSAMQTNSKMNSKFFVNSLQKPSGEPQDQDVFIEEMTRYPSFSKSLIPSSEGLHLSLPESSKMLMSGTQKHASTSPSRHSGCGHGCDRRPRSAHQFQVALAKTPSGDLLEKHSDLFSNKQSPFTPRTLKTEAKSFLSQYRYYTPAKRRKDFSDQRMEAETQTELSSFNSELGTAEKTSSKDSEVNINQVPNYTRNGAEDKIAPLPSQGQNLAWDSIQDGILQQSSERASCKLSTEFSPDSKIYSDEEELLYLSFMENVTDEILKLGLFSNRFLERLFERHIKKNKHHLEEGKMRYLLHGLKVDLGCISEEDPAKQKHFRMLNQLHFQKALISRENEFVSDEETVSHHERQQYQEALDMLSAVPKDENKMFSLPGEFLIPAHKVKHSEGVIIQQVNDETDNEASPWNENNPSVSDSVIDQETSVDVIEGDSDFERAETSRELCCLSTSLSPSGPFPSINGGSNHGKELSTLRIMGMSIED
ncbi:spermatogenesis-associated protein 7 homolog isoform 1 [Mus musculus]|uniref:Spermatogenesis-associated protein 7 homolog n=3 Tax=Mus musculus TaxID=10090 RepID=SPAT7_MOUSE|nr:spermatogenesis-associated protein 7 homolog isoform 1 [Mus musculus]Q80VP2.1 RecName: Full=Spermatogenesis-associated protein 7 homolog [Mus musculus]AAH46960.1 Spermatogenesis associated 7 [Mus musculus]|eukprot:NP_849245.2 spermatogenesis-associated protein 7 homolog isoform 1 [Mus musculus]